MIECVIFDCDGTLVDSEPLTHLGLEMKLAELGIEESHEEMMARFRGGKLSEILGYYEKKHNRPFDDGFVPSYRALVSDLFEQYLKPCAGVAELLPKIEVPICVASNAPLSKVRKGLGVTGLAAYFGENLFSAYQVQVWKPEPDLFLYAAEMMGAQPDHCVVVEDTLLGVEAAVAAGMRPILYDPQERYGEIEGVVVINYMGEVLSVLA